MYASRPSWQTFRVQLELYYACPLQFLHDPWIQELLSNSILPVSYTKKHASN